MMYRSVILATLACVALTSGEVADNKTWYRNSLVYQIYPRSFKDSDGDGIGDLNGITEKLAHIADIGADAIWLSPIFSSPQADFGYDISNFTDIDPTYGTLADFDRLVQRARSFKLKVLLDFVPNHSSDEHEWFNKSVNRVKPYDEYYVWSDGKVVNGTRHPPNNWLSVFGGSAWEYNNKRGQYYLHQFVAKQPDFNYRSAALRQEMLNTLSFWMDRGVEGFRIDSLNYLFEDARLLDEPRTNTSGVPSDDYFYLDHVYTKDQEENYGVLESWRKLLDDHSRKNKSDVKMILTEAYGPLNMTVRYYKTGSTVPFNFMFISDLDNKSTALDFKRHLDSWMNNMPEGDFVANWVVGNHDNHRAASRFGVKRADQLNMLSTILPGIGIIYNGDEIGMVDRPFTYAETVDPAGCNAGPDRYQLKSRDPERTPFQWDATTSAGFSTNNKTWLPVHSNYKSLNLALESVVPDSSYKVFKALRALKRHKVIESGSLQVSLVTEKVLGVVRRVQTPNGQSVVVLLINFSDEAVVVNAMDWLNIPQKLVIYTSSVGSRMRPGYEANTRLFVMSGSASVVLVSPELRFSP